jgi:hypothetical protein
MAKPQPTDVTITHRLLGNTETVSVKGSRGARRLTFNVDFSKGSMATIDGYILRILKAVVAVA